MDPFAAFALTVGSVIALSNQAALVEHYAHQARHARTIAVEPAWEAPPAAYVYPAPAAYVPADPVAYVPAWTAGAAVGTQIGALAGAASGDPRGVIAGALLGGVIGQAATLPPPHAHHHVAHAPRAAHVPPPSPARAAASREFTQHWQDFMQPSAGRAAPQGAPRGFGRTP